MAIHMKLKTKNTNRERERQTYIVDGRIHTCCSNFWCLFVVAIVVSYLCFVQLPTFVSSFFVILILSFSPSIPSIFNFLLFFIEQIGFYSRFSHSYRCRRRCCCWRKSHAKCHWMSMILIIPTWRRHPFIFAHSDYDYRDRILKRLSVF